MAYGRGYQVRIGPLLTPIVKYLVITNAAVFFWQILSGFVGANEIIRIFGLTPYLVLSRLYIWQLLTYLFLHGDFLHILFNMFALWMFGSELERNWGGREFLKFYFVVGVGAGILSVLVDPFSLTPTIGASGAIYGILMAYGLLFPERYVYLYFLFPIKVKYFVVFLGLMSFVSALSAPGSTIAHIAHLGGMVFAYLYLKGWLSLGGVRQSYYRWRLKRMRERFKVYEGEQRRESHRREDDFWIN